MLNNSPESSRRACKGSTQFKTGALALFFCLATSSAQLAAQANQPAQPLPPTVRANLRIPAVPHRTLTDLVAKASASPAGKAMLQRAVAAGAPIRNAAPTQPPAVNTVTLSPYALIGTMSPGGTTMHCYMYLSPAMVQGILPDGKPVYSLHDHFANVTAGCDELVPAGWYAIAYDFNAEQADAGLQYVPTITMSAIPNTFTTCDAASVMSTRDANHTSTCVLLLQLASTQLLSITVNQSDGWVQPVSLTITRM